MRSINYIYAGLLFLASTPVLAFDTLSCVSQNNSLTVCELPFALQRDIRLIKIVSGNCDLDNTWGVDTSVIWVDKGCGGVFEYTGPYDPNDTTIVIAPGYVKPFYGPRYYYGAGYYQSLGWYSGTACQGDRCSQLHVMPK